MRPTERAPEAAAAPAAAAPMAEGLKPKTELVLIPGGKGKAVHMKQGDILKVTNTHGTQVSDNRCFVALSERGEEKAAALNGSLFCHSRHSIRPTACRSTHRRDVTPGFRIHAALAWTAAFCPPPGQQQWTVGHQI